MVCSFQIKFYDVTTNFFLNLFPQNWGIILNIILPQGMEGKDAGNLSVMGINRSKIAHQPLAIYMKNIRLEFIKNSFQNMPLLETHQTIFLGKNDFL